MNRALKNHLRGMLFVLLFGFLSFLALALCYIYFPVERQPNLYFYLTLAVGAFFLFLTFIFGLIFNRRMRRIKSKAEMTSAEILGNDINEAYNFGQVGLVVTDRTGLVLWTNEFLSERFPTLIDSDVKSFFPEFQAFDGPEGKRPSKIQVDYEAKTYDVEYLSEAHLYLFRDVTDYENECRNSANQAPVVGYLSIDNYSDVQVWTADDTKFTEMLTKTRSLIAANAKEYGAMLKKISEDKYLFLSTAEMFQKAFSEKFKIVDEVRNSFLNGFTISIGVSYGFPDYSKLSEEASNALDVALSRGGDQTVIAPFGQSMIYLGGKSELKPARNRVKIRTLSNSFLSILRSYKKVLIMGHANADFDAIGSSLGVYLLCQHVRVPAKITFEDQEVEGQCRTAVQANFSAEEMKTIFINMKKVSDYADKETLLVLCDHSNPDLSMFKGYQDKVAAVAIIDHHRMGEHVVEDPVFNGIDTSSSSASELVTNYITYNLDNIPIDSRTATFLLAGICLDTHFFKEKATNSTFEAAAQLKNYNADSGKVDDFLKENLEEYQQKIAILNNSSYPYASTMVSLSPDDQVVSPVMLSMVANEAVSIRGITSAYCIGRTGPHDVRISARSDGSVNCQLLMEKLGGGGHLQMAAAAFKDVSVDDVKNKLMQALKDYLDDARNVSAA